MEDVGNSNILPIFCKIIGNMPCFETRFTQNRVQRRYKSLKCRYMQKKKKKKTCMELDLEKIKFQNVAIGP